MRSLTRFTATLISMFAAANAHAQATNKLDLVCHTKTEQPMRFRLDLAQKKWCWGPCQSVWVIDEIDDGAIRLSVHSADRQHDWNMILNRYTGTLSAVHVGWGNESADGGRCAAEPFSGFPQKQF